jgi:hypothetical protein
MNKKILLVLFVLFLIIFVIFVKSRSDKNDQLVYKVDSDVLSNSSTNKTDDSIIATTSLPSPSFNDYPVTEIYSGTPAAPDFKKNSEARSHITYLTLGAKEGPNFAGHYTVVEIGCGSPCQFISVIDAKTGEIFFNKLNTFIGSRYRLDSNLFIANPPENRGDDSWNNFPAEYYVWENNEFRRISIGTSSDLSNE